MKLKEKNFKNEKNIEDKEVHRKLNQLNEKLEQLFEENENKNKEIKTLKKEKNAIKCKFEVQIHENKILSEKLEFQQEMKEKPLKITPQKISKLAKIKSSPKLVQLPKRYPTPDLARSKYAPVEKLNMTTSPKHKKFNNTSKSSRIANMIDAMSTSFVPSVFDDGNSMVLSQHTLMSNENTIHEINSLRNSVHQLNKQKIDIFKEMTLLNDKYNNSKNENNKLQNLVSTCMQKINQLNEISESQDTK
jgi:hypothetical protein